MKILTLLTLTIGLIFLSGCAAGIVGKIPHVDDNNSATVHIARKSGFMGCGNAFLIRLNDEDFIRINCGMKTHFKVPAGERIKVSSVSSLVSDDFYLVPVKRENYYFGMDCNFGACWFDKLRWEEYNSIAETCSEALLIEQETKTTVADNTNIQQSNIFDAKKQSLKTNNDTESNRLGMENPDYERSIQAKSDTGQFQKKSLEANTETKKEAPEQKAVENKRIGANLNEAKKCVNRGVAFVQKKQFDEAVREFTKAINLEPNYRLAYYNRGWVFYTKSEYERAIKDFNAALTLNPNDSNSYYNRGLCYYSIREIDQAKQDFQMACDLGDKDGCKKVKGKGME